MTNIKFAHATADDLERLVELRLIAMRPSLEAIGRFNPDRARQRFVNEFEPEHTRLIFENDKLVGCFALLPRKDHLYLGHFYLHPDMQGKGIGKLVMKDILGAATALKRPIKLITLNESPAIGFYEALGFSVTASDDVETTMEWSPSR